MWLTATTQTRPQAAPPGSYCWLGRRRRVLGCVVFFFCARTPHTHTHTPMGSCIAQPQSQQKLLALRVVAKWSPEHVYCWLKAWGVPSRVFLALYAARVNGIRLQDLFYALDNKSDPAWDSIGVSLTPNEEDAFNVACTYLDARSWVLSTWVRGCSARFFIIFLYPR